MTGLQGMSSNKGVHLYQQTPGRTWQDHIVHYHLTSRQSCRQLNGTRSQHCCKAPSTCWQILDHHNAPAGENSKYNAGTKASSKTKARAGHRLGQGQEPRECNARSETTAMSAAREWQGYSYRHRIDLRDGLALRHVPSYQWRKGLTA